MRFINPVSLWLLPLGLIPIVIYYLMRFRSLRVQWGAAYVLERALQKLRKQFYWDQLLLIALRVLACLLLVIVFSRPTSGVSRTGGIDGTHRILLFDGSYSMLAGDGDQTRWEQSQEIARQLANGWGRGQVWSLLQVTEDPSWIVDGATLNSPEEVLTQLKQLKPQESPARLLRGFQQLAGKFPDGNLEVYVFADDQAGSWEGIEELALPPNTMVYWICPPLTNRANLAVTSIAVANERVLLGHPDQATVKVRNFSAEAVKNVEVELLVDNAFIARESVSLLAGQEATLTFSVSFSKTGSHQVAARIQQDALKYDNAAYAGVDVPAGIKVLVLRDPEVAEKFASPWDFMAVVGRLPQELDEFEEHVFDWAAPEFVLDEKAATPDCSGYDVVMLDGSRTVTRELADGLRNFVHDGGSLILAADPNINSTGWNEELGRVGLLPAPLVRIHQEELGGAVFQALSRGDLGGGLAGFAETADGDLGNSRFYRWYEFGDPVPGATVLARFTDRKPFLVEQRFEPGSVLLLAGGLNGNYNNLIVREFFLPFVFRLVSQAAAGNIFRRTLQRAEPVRLRLTNPAEVRAVKFDAPDEESIAVQNPGAIVTIPGGSPVSGLCSLLVVRGAETSWVWYGVQGPRLDSDLTALDDAAKQRLLQDYGFVEVTDWSALQEKLLQKRAGNEWHHWLIIILLAVFAGEMLLQRRFV